METPAKTARSPKVIGPPAGGGGGGRATVHAPSSGRPALAAVAALASRPQQSTAAAAPAAAAAPTPAAARPDAASSVITISGKQAEAVSPEGQRASMPLADLVRKLLPSQLDTGDLVLPDGTKAVLSRGDFTILVHQTAPAVHNMKWIAEGSPAPFGPGTKYDEDVRIAQPYIIVFAVFQRRKPGGELVLSGRNEAFYRTAPLTSLSDTLMYPALLNCSKYKRQPEKHSLSWICTAKLDPSPFNRLKDNNALVRAGFRALMQTLLESGFNYSSEAHEGASWYGETLRVTMDERLKIKNWQEESKRSPLFVLDFKWLETGMTVAQVADRIFNLCGAAAKDVSSSEEVARVIFNNKV